MTQNNDSRTTTFVVLVDEDEKVEFLDKLTAMDEVEGHTEVD